MEKILNFNIVDLGISRPLSRFGAPSKTLAGGPWPPRPPSHHATAYNSLDKYLADSEDQLQKVDHNKTEIVSMGNFNVDMLSKTGPKGFSQPVRGFLLASDLDQVIEKSDESL